MTSEALLEARARKSYATYLKHYVADQKKGYIHGERDTMDEYVQRYKDAQSNPALVRSKNIPKVLAQKSRIVDTARARKIAHAAIDKGVYKGNVPEFIKEMQKTPGAYKELWKEAARKGVDLIKEAYDYEEVEVTDEGK